MSAVATAPSTFATQWPDIFGRLNAPFPDEKVRQNGKGGGNLRYVTARQVMNRLDDVLGPENWEDSYLVFGESVLCGITITLPNGQRVTKFDAGGAAGMADSGDDDKSAFSDAFKRAAKKFGVARYTMNDGVPGFAAPYFEGYHAGAGAQGQPSSQPSTGGGGSNGSAGTNGTNGGQREYPLKFDCPPARGMFPWIKKVEEHTGVGVLNAVNTFAKAQGFPYNFKDCDEAQTIAIYSYAVSLWKENGVWPGGEALPPQSQPAANAPRQTGKVEDCQEVKSKVRAAATAILNAANSKVTYPALMEVINSAARRVGAQPIANIVEYADKGVLEQILGDLLTPEGDEEDIPF